jgi:predicted NBD/HSP70 family sugar kinase
LIRFAQGAFKTAEEVIAAGQAGDSVAAEAIRKLAGHLATGTASIIQILDPEMVILSGGIIENNSLLLRHFQEELQSRVPVWEHRNLQVQASRLGYFSGVLGAVAAVLEKLECDAQARFRISMQSPTSFLPARGKDGGQ